MSTFIAIFFVFWCVFGAALYINAMINWERITKPYKQMFFFIVCGPLVWLIGTMYFIADSGYELIYVRIRNWFIS